MSKTIYPATLLCDFYKISHREQYPEGTTKVYSTWTPRRSLIKGIDNVVVFGIQAFVHKYLVEYFKEHFFNRSKEEVVAEYERIIKHTLNPEVIDSSHIAELHDLGYLPIKVCALKEGTVVPVRTPILTIENTHPDFFWLTNYFETLMSCELWMPSTSATIAKRYRDILDKYAKETSSCPAAVDFQAHDFSMRGMSSVESAAASGAGHLLSFIGTDNIPAINYLEKYYHANVENELVGTSIPATEHSVMCSYGQNELESYKRLITEVYPKGFVSIVSDTWDFWHVVTSVIPQLKDEIMNRDGRVVIRPDSGDPVKIICGNSEGKTEAERNGLIYTLYKIFGGSVNKKGYAELDSHIGAIYGDSITLERAEEICKQLKAKGFASTNVVFGVGSFSYQYNTRDTFGFALKSTYCVVNDEERMIFKNPKTDTSKFKKSQKGMVVVSCKDGEWTYTDNLIKESHDSLCTDPTVNKLKVIFKDGSFCDYNTLQNIRDILKNPNF